MRVAGVILAIAAWAGAAQAQTMRPFATFRQTHGETRLGVRLDYAAGNIRIAPGRSAELYRMDLSYDEDRFVPLSDYDAASGSVVLGLRAAGDAGVRVVSRNQLSQVAAVAFSPRPDLALDLNFGAVDADVELGGLKITSLALQTGASRTVVRFSHPNLSRCRRADFSAGAAEFSVLGLGNSRCDEIGFEGGIGKVTLDFSGAWTSSARVQVKMAMGELNLRLPRKAGVSIVMDRFLSSFEPVGLLRRGNRFVSENYDRSQRHLDINLTTAIGGVNVEWVDSPESSAPHH